MDTDWERMTISADKDSLDHVRHVLVDRLEVSGFFNQLYLNPIGVADSKIYCYVIVKTRETGRSGGQQRCTPSRFHHIECW